MFLEFYMHVYVFSIVHLSDENGNPLRAGILVCVIHFCITSACHTVGTQSVSRMNPHLWKMKLRHREASPPKVAWLGREQGLRQLDS